MAETKNKELICRSVEEFYNTGDMGAIDRLFAPDYVHHQPPTIQDMQQFRQACTGIFAAFPDLKITIYDLFESGDVVTKRWTATGTHKGEFMGVPASGKAIDADGISIYRIVGDKIAECWEVMDALTLMQQIGAIPTP